MKIRKTVLAITAIATLCATAQISTSPYSKIGYGLLNDNASGIQRQMGGVGYAMQNGRAINVMNPASYSQVDSLTFLWDVGVDLNNAWSHEGDLKGYNFGGGLDYLSAQFRIIKGLGGSFGLVPYSSVGYQYVGEIDGGAEARTGSGGLLQLYIGAGYEPIKNLSLGFNVSYLFGTTTNTSSVASTSTTTYQRIMEVRDWNITAGIQYGIDLSLHDRMVLGVSYTPKKSFHGHTWGTMFDSQDSKIDTLGYTSLKGKYEQPHTIGVGLSYNHANHWLTEIDVTYQKWKDAKYEPLQGFESATTSFDNRWKVAAGLQFTPNRRGTYIGAMAFRVGGFYNHDYLMIGSNNVRDYGATVGVGLPVPGGKTTINLGLEWRHRTSSPLVMIKEDYLNITLSVNFNELWFWKNRIR
ncbi:MAG: hypothetical protein J6S96_03500 [Muribaculaceae bacterium]|nr:hypothetical protein [Muribaculaceae bacterium]